MRLLESVPNVSSGRDTTVVAAIAEAVEARGARVLDVHSDADHNRSVLTIVGEDEVLVESLLACVATAAELIDLREHDGVHPRVGAADVVPIVPLRAEDAPRAAFLARELARRIGLEVGLPVFLYGDIGDGKRPVFFRRGGTEALEARIRAGELVPDHGPPTLDPRAGAVLVGARAPLVAFNLELDTADVDIARSVAAAVRESSGGLTGVQALGLLLTRTGRAQVSMNITDVEAVPLHKVVERVAEECALHDTRIAAGELVGLMPAAVAAAGAARAFALETLPADRILETRLADDPA